MDYARGRRRTAAWLHASLLMALLLAPVARAEEAKEEAKPNTFPSWQDRLDYVHDHLFLRLNRHVIRWDSIGAAEDEELEEVPPSTFKLTLEFKYEQDGSKSKINMNPALKIDLRLPNLERRARLFIDFSDVDELPGTTPSERTNEPRIGVGWDLVRDLKNKELLSLSAGVKWRVPPVGFADLELKRLRPWGENGRVYPRVKGFYETDDGFGSLASMLVDKWPRDDILVQSTTAGVWSEKSQGVEWEQSLMVVYYFKTFLLRSTNIDNVHRGVGMKGSVFGHKSGSGVVDRYRLTLGYRIPLYKEWIYLTLYPEVQWRDENDWKADPGTRVAFDFFFWGTPNR